MKHLQEILNVVRALHPEDQLQVVNACQGKLFIPEYWDRTTLESIIDRPVSELEWQDFIDFVHSGKNSCSFEGPYIESCWDIYVGERGEFGGGIVEMINEMFADAADADGSKTEPPSFGEFDSDQSQP